MIAVLGLCALIVAGGNLMRDRCKRKLKLVVPSGSRELKAAGLVLRDLQRDDWSRDFLGLLSQLTTVGIISKRSFIKRFNEIHNSDMLCIGVIHDVAKDEIVGTATLVVEPKFIHACGYVGHIEDVVVSSDHRGKKLGSILIDALVKSAVQAGCYKVILDCDNMNVPFYEKCGLKCKGVQMGVYLQ